MPHSFCYAVFQKNSCTFESGTLQCYQGIHFMEKIFIADAVQVLAKCAIEGNKILRNLNAKMPIEEPPAELLCDYVQVRKISVLVSRVIRLSEAYLYVSKHIQGSCPFKKYER